MRLTNPILRIFNFLPTYQSAYLKLWRYHFAETKSFKTAKE